MDEEREKFDEETEPKISEDGGLLEEEETENALDQVDLGEPMDDRYSL